MGNSFPIIQKTDYERYKFIVQRFLSATGATCENIELETVLPQAAVVIYKVSFPAVQRKWFFIFQKLDDNRVVVWQQYDAIKPESLRYAIYQIYIDPQQDYLERYQHHSVNPFRSGSKVYSFKPETYFDSLIIKMTQFLVDYNRSFFFFAL